MQIRHKIGGYYVKLVDYYAKRVIFNIKCFLTDKMVFYRTDKLKWLDKFALLEGHLYINHASNNSKA